MLIHNEPLKWWDWSASWYNLMSKIEHNDSHWGSLKHEPGWPVPAPLTQSFCSNIHLDKNKLLQGGVTPTILFKIWHIVSCVSRISTPLLYIIISVSILSGHTSALHCCIVTTVSGHTCVTGVQWPESRVWWQHWSPSTPCFMSNHIKYSAHDSSNSAFYVLSEIVCDPNFAWNNIFSFNGSALVLAWAGRRLNKNVAKGQNSVIKRVNGRDINKINVKIQNGTKNKMIKHMDRMKHKKPALQANIITTAELICLQSKDSYLCMNNPKSSANTKLTRLRRCLTMTPLLTVLTMSMVKSVCPVIHNISQCWLFSVSTTWWSLVWWPLTLQCHPGQQRTNNTQ